MVPWALETTVLSLLSIILLHTKTQKYSPQLKSLIGVFHKGYKNVKIYIKQGANNSRKY